MYGLGWSSFGIEWWGRGREWFGGDIRRNAQLEDSLVSVRREQEILWNECMPYIRELVIKKDFSVPRDYVKLGLVRLEKQ